MADEVVGSYPYQEWADEVQAALFGKGVESEVSYAGPRAFTVAIDASDSFRAQKILSDVGYFACATGSRASMSGVLDWWPSDGIDMDELKDEISRLIEHKIEEYANIGAAEARSTQPDDDSIPERYEDPWYLAEFDGHFAVNGDHLDSVAFPIGYVLYHDGRLPSVEQMVYFEHVARAVANHESLNKYPQELVNQIVTEIWKGYYKGAIEVPVYVSGNVEIWAKEKEGYEHGD